LSITKVKSLRWDSEAEDDDVEDEPQNKRPRKAVSSAPASTGPQPGAARNFSIDNESQEKAPRPRKRAKADNSATTNLAQDDRWFAPEEEDLKSPKNPSGDCPTSDFASDRVEVPNAKNMTIYEVLLSPCISLSPSPNICSQLFSHFFTTAIVAAIVMETNNYAKSHFNVDLGLNVDEFMIYIACILAIAQRGHSGSRRNLWGSDPIDDFPFIKSLISRDRFEEINRYFHLPEGPKEIHGAPDPYWKVSWLASLLDASFRVSWNPSWVFIIIDSILFLKSLFKRIL